MVGREIVSERLVITGLKCRRSLADSLREWHRVRGMTALRALRRTLTLSQHAFAAILFIWTKDADMILDKIARCPKASNA